MAGIMMNHLHNKQMTGVKLICTNGANEGSVLRWRAEGSLYDEETMRRFGNFRNPGSSSLYPCKKKSALKKAEA